MKIDQNLITTLLILDKGLRDNNIPYVIIGALAPVLLIDFTGGSESSGGSRVTRNIDIVVNTNS